MSKTFPFTGIIGTSAFPEAGPDWQEIAWATAPWEPFPIKILSVSLDVNVVSDIPANEGPFALEAFVGNSYRADQMTPTRRQVSQIGQKSLGVKVDKSFPYSAGGFPFAAATREKDPI